MKIFSILLFLWSILPAFSQEKKKNPLKGWTYKNTIHASRARQAVSTNGILSEWNVPDSVVMTGKIPSVSNMAIVKMMWDDKKLYFAFKVFDTQLNAFRTDNEVGIYKEDCIELYLSIFPGKAPLNYLSKNEFQFLVNANGNYFPIKGNDSVSDESIERWGNRNYNWKTDVFTAVKLWGTINNNADTDHYYVVETAVNWFSLGYTPREGDTLLADFAVNDLDSNQVTESFDWSSLSNMYHRPRSWGKVILTGDLRAESESSASSGNKEKKLIYFLIPGICILILAFFYLYKKRTAKPADLYAKPVPNQTAEEPKTMYPAASGYKKRIADKAVNLISEKYNSQLSVDKVAEESAVSVRQLQRVLKEVTGKTFTELLTEKRLEKSKDLLETSALNISELSFQVGFESIDSFRLFFKKKYKISPADYRKNYFASK